MRIVSKQMCRKLIAVTLKLKVYERVERSAQSRFLPVYPYNDPFPSF